jgi:hypothetical protein
MVDRYKCFHGVYKPTFTSLASDRAWKMILRAMDDFLPRLFTKFQVTRMGALSIRTHLAKLEMRK